jgi:hypothetical protein
MTISGARMEYASNTHSQVWYRWEGRVCSPPHTATLGPGYVDMRGSPLPHTLSKYSLFLTMRFTRTNMT